jgi:serine/threonine protein kinase
MRRKTRCSTVKVAVKFLPDVAPQQKTAVERFINEAQVAGRLNHPNIIAIYDIGYEHDTYYIAMELLNPGSRAPTSSKRGA